MSLKQLYAAVARATGESPSEIRRRGFSIANPEAVNFDPEPYDLPREVLDWDQYQAARQIAILPHRTNRSLSV